MRLVYGETGEEVKVGDIAEVNTANGTEKVVVDYFRKPHKPSSTGKVTVKYPDGSSREYYVGVIGAMWVEREDQEGW